MALGRGKRMSRCLCHRMVFETSKLSLEQIDEMYERVGRAWNTRQFEPSWSFQQILDEGWSPSGQSHEHELETTASQFSHGTTLDNSDASSVTAHNDHSAQQHSNDTKAVPVMASVDFSY